ncbi:MAG: hypothetical protein ACOY3P_20100 [Planctomycetota bacterium]
MPIEDTGGQQSLADMIAEDNAAQAPPAATADSTPPAASADSTPPADDDLGDETPDAGSDDRAADDQDSGDDDAGSTPPTTSLMERLRAKGVDVSKYSDDEALLQGLLEAQRLVGTRNEDAARWQRLATVIGDRGDEFREVLRQFVAGTQTAPAAAPPQAVTQKDVDELPASIYEASLLAQAVYDAEEKVKPGQEANARRLAAMERKIQATVLQLARDPASFLKPMFEQFRQELSREFRTEAQQVEQVRQTQTALQQVIQKHKDVLYEGGNLEQAKLTPFGNKVLTELREVESQFGNANPQANLQMAIRLAQAGLPKPNQPRPGAARAARVPAVAPMKSEPDDLDRKILAGEITLEELERMMPPDA